MRRTVIAAYSIVLGLAVLGLWAMLLTGDALPEGPIELAFHATSEAIMALACIAAGVLALRAAPFAPAATAAAHAMVIYSTLNAAGYYAAQGAIAVASIMTALTVISGTIVLSHLHRRPAEDA